ncbi:GAF and ANTAR domain-containing protein [Cryobacterium sp. PH31-L1]|uniref:GAF and ANTAR domain-containing protein n=1 Tax=Cryobacterium sp. PH31-L1 TaxID=3046199 RepID=UPI0024BBA364|nr:GAF and ANTAR domain-containing protein [Cryobacterium sp. PH31-L1]MDJ0377641.1 GAF and ANTAR domain-containing protein [Cryobacterium sp. PH31-L1]
MTDRGQFGAAVEALSAAYERQTSMCHPFVRALPIDAASVCTLGEPFGSETVCASNAVAATFDELQFDLGEGPSWDAMTTRRPVRIDDLHSVRHSPWPALLKATRDIDVQSVYAFPLTMGSLDIGAVSLFSHGRGTLTPSQIVDAEVLAQIAASQVLRRSLASRTLKTNLEDNEGHSRRVVHQATGMVLAQLDLSAADALLIIHGHAFSHGRTVREVAADVVTRRLDFSSMVES